MWTFCSWAVMLRGLWEEPSADAARYDTRCTWTVFLAHQESRNPAFPCNLSSHPHFQGGPESSRFSFSIIMFLLLSYSKQTLSMALKSVFFFFVFHKTCYDNFSHDTRPQTILSDSISTKTIPLPDVQT